MKTSANCLKSNTLLLILIMSITTNIQKIFANTATWTGSTDNTWTHTGNWSGGSGISGNPVSGDDIYIPFGGGPTCDIAITIGNLTIEKGGNLYLDGSDALLCTGNANIDGEISTYGSSLTIEGNLQNFTQGTGYLHPGASTITISGDMTISAMDYQNSTFNFNGTSDQYVSGYYFYYLTIANTSHKVTLGGYPTTVYGNMLISGTNCEVDLGNNLWVLGEFIISASSAKLKSEGFDIQFNGLVDGIGTIDCSGGSSAGYPHVSIAGDMTIANFICGTSTVSFGGTSLNINGYTFYNVAVNMTSDVSLIYGNVTISNNLYFISGKLILSNYYLIITTGATISNASASTGYVETNASGSIIMDATNGGVIYPVGATSTDYDPITLNPDAGHSPVTCSVGVNTGLNVSLATDASHVVNLTWIIQPTSGSVTNMIVTTTWNSGQQASSFTLYNDYVAFSTNPATVPWISLDNQTQTPSGTDPYSLSSAYTFSITDGTIYYLAVADHISGLPVTITTFNAQYLNNKVDLSWVTASEINNNYFDIERSLDGQYWQNIGSVDGNGNSQIQHSYYAIDNLVGIVLSGNLYYRLKQVDYNGAYTYSMIRTVTFNSKNETVQMYPNPVSSQLIVKWTSFRNEGTILKVLNTNGAIIWQKDETGIGEMTEKIDMVSEPAGIYFVELLTEGTSVTKIISRN